MTRLLRRAWSRGIGNDTGTSLVEAAIATPLLLFMTFAIIDFSVMFYVYLALANGVGQAARYASTGNVVAGQSRETSIKMAMRDATPTLTIPDAAFSFSHMPIGTATWVAGSGLPNDIAKVTVRYDWEFYTPIVRPFFTNGQIQLLVESAMKNEPSVDR